MGAEVPLVLAGRRRHGPVGLFVDAGGGRHRIGAPPWSAPGRRACWGATATPGLAGKLARGLTTTYIEIVRGTPLAFQLFVVYFVLPDLGITISAFWSGVLALAVELFRL